MTDWRQSDPPTWTAADPLTVDDAAADWYRQGWQAGHASEPYATVDEGNPAAVIVWILGAFVAALLAFVAVVVMRHE